MCWNAEVSAASAVGAWLVCAYLWYRNHNNDRWSAVYLLTFTFTQVVDVVLWMDEDTFGLSTCSETNLVTSKYVIPMVVFSQHAVQCYYPSEYLKNHRLVLALLHLLPVLGKYSCVVTERS